MKFYKCLSFLIVLLLLAGVNSSVAAQTSSDYAVHLRRDFGYGGGVNIRGKFTISLVGDEAEVAQVRFLLDGETMATRTSPPFRFQFQTDDYGFGTHRLWAEVQLKDDTLLTTEALQYNFVSPETEREQIIPLFIGIGGALVVTLIIVGGIQYLISRGKSGGRRQPGEARRYGLLGGAICPKCGRPFVRHLWGMNLVVGRLDRCDNCGKWVMTTRATPEALQAAEAAEQAAEQADQVAADDAWRPEDSLDETRFVDEI